MSVQRPVDYYLTRLRSHSPLTESKIAPLTFESLSWSGLAGELPQDRL